jgi:hypothetical protein
MIILIRTSDIPYDLSSEDRVTFFVKGEGLQTGNFIRRNRSSIKVKKEDGTEVNVHRTDLYSIKVIHTGEEYYVEYKHRLYNNDITEMCPHCDNETVLKNKKEKQPCKYCGKMIKPCCICDMDKVKCSECYLGED